MKGAIGFGFFILFVAGFALVNLKNMQEQSELTAADLSSSIWRLTHLGDSRQPDDTKISLQFANEEEFSGFAGCNQFFGKYTLENSILNMESIGATRKSCAEPTMSTETTLLQTLESAHSVHRVGNRMAIKNDENVTTARFVAVEDNKTGNNS